MMGRRRFIEVVREEVKLVGVGEEDAEDKRVRWRDVIGCAPHTPPGTPAQPATLSCSPHG